MIDKKQTIEILIKQHRGLEHDLAAVNLELTITPTNVATVLSNLNKFKTDLLAHLALENNVFYKQLLEDMQSDGQNPNDTIAFIDKMKEIEAVVLGFLEKYATTEAITADLTKFNLIFKSIVDTLELRIETEESGVYTYWL